MAVIIHNMSLPQNCWHCSLSQITSGTEEFAICALIGDLGYIYSNEKERNSKCPLRSYPPKPIIDPWDGEKPHAPEGFWEKYCAPYKGE